MQTPNFLRTVFSVFAASFLAMGIGPVQAVPVSLVNATATFSQTLAGDFSVSNATDGNLPGPLGWAIAIQDGSTSAQTAVWETSSDISATTLAFELFQSSSNNGLHLIGNFRLSVTTDDRSLFADGLQSGGDVFANWTELTGATISSTAAGQTFSVLGDNSILAGGTTPANATYSVSYAVLLAGITGIRLEVLENSNLPANGPGLASNGNFVLTEITLDASGTLQVVPLPAALPLFASGLGLMGLLGWRRRRQTTAS